MGLLGRMTGWFFDDAEPHAIWGGWYVERDGRRVALLTDPMRLDMFWYAWHLDPLTEDQDERTALFTAPYWLAPGAFERTVYRSREFDMIADAFTAIGRPIIDGRLNMRGLYQPVRRAMRVRGCDE